MEQRSSITLEHTLARLARLDLLIRREVLGLRLHHAHQQDDEFRGLYISEEEVDALLCGSSPASSFLAAPLLQSDQLPAIETAISALNRRIEALEAAAVQDGEILPLVRLGQLFGLSAFEGEVLVICLAAELDLKYERLYAYLQDDVTKKRPTVDLVMRLLCPTVEERLAARHSFTPGAPLVRWDLVTLHDDPGARRPVLLSRYLKLDERIAGYLLGSGEVDAHLIPLLVDRWDQTPSARSSTQPMQDEAACLEQAGFDISPAIRVQLEEWAAGWLESWADVAPVVLFHGRYGSGKRAAAHSLAAALGRPLLLLGLTEMGAGDLGLAHALKLAEREALLTGAVLGLAEADAFLHPQPDMEADHRVLVHSLARGRVPTILLADKSWEPARSLEERPFLRLGMPDPTYAEREAVWSRHLPSTHADLGALAGRFRLTPGQVRDAVSRARTLAWARDPGNGHVTTEDIDAACRTQAQHRLDALARKLNPRYTWDDIVLPRPQLSTLRLICTTVRHRPTVYDDWGFDRKLSLGKGLIALFAGPSGTGKTMAAEIIAHELGLDVYKIDLSAVVSKYIGETEKNLERVFGEAQDSDAILFFDEADALFGKRSEVKDAHDRYANIETAYLLQRTEEYNGLVILASNIKKNMDEAFVRRLHFMVDFPFPEEAERLEIWRRTLPREAPRAEDIDWPFLARKLKITGGNIRNIILTAAFLAAEDRQPISMRHLVRGAGYEFQKMGKLVVEGDFEKYFDLLRA